MRYMNTFLLSLRLHYHYHYWWNINHEKEQIQRFLPSSKLNAKTTTSSHGTPLMFAATSDSKSTPALYFLYSDFDLSDVRLTDVGSLYYIYSGELSMKCIFSVITIMSGNASYCMFESFSWGESNYCRLNHRPVGGRSMLKPNHNQIIVLTSL